MSTPEPAPDPLEQLAEQERAAHEAAAERAAALTDQARPPAEAEAPPGPPEGSTPAEAAAWRARFADENTMFDSYTQLERKLGEQGNELGRLRAFEQQMLQQQQTAQAQIPAGQQQTLPDGTPYFDPAQLQQLVDNGDLTEFQGNMLWADQQAKIHAYEMEERMQQRLAPIQQAHVTSGAQNTLDRLNVDLGDDVVARHSALITDMIQKDRTWFADPDNGLRRLEDAVIAAEFRHQQSGGSEGRPRDAAGRFIPDVNVEGGSSAQPPQAVGGTPQDPLIESLTARPKVDEMGIPIRF